MFGATAPMLPEPYNNNYRIFQTPDHVVILVEMNHEPRVIPLDGRAAHFAGDRAMDRRLARPFRGRHARRRDAQLQVQRAEPLRRRLVERPERREPARRRTLHAHGSRHDHVSGHDRGPDDLHEPVDRRGPAAPERRADLRSRVPRGQLGARRTSCRGIAPKSAPPPAVERTLEGKSVQLKPLSFAIGRALVGAGAAACAAPCRSSAPRSRRRAATPCRARAWGDPDLAGKWPGTDMVGVPMQRDEKLGHPQRAHRRGVRRARAPRRSDRRSRTTPTSSSRTRRARRAATSAAPCRLLRTGSSAASRSGKRR